jgi:hypothetical protein
MNPWRICPPPETEVDLTLDVWVTPEGLIDGALELSPSSALSSSEARELVASQMRQLLEGHGLPRPGPFAMATEPPHDQLDASTSVLVMAWDDLGRCSSGPGYGPVSQGSGAPRAVRPLRDLIDWTLQATAG